MESEGDHRVIQGNENFGDSDQGDLSAHQVVVEPVGQPTREYEGWKHFDIRIEPSVVEYLRALGGGDLAEGIRIAAKFHQAASKGDK